MKEIQVKIKNSFSGTDFENRLPFSGENFNLVVVSRDKELKLVFNQTDVFGPVILKLGTVVGEKSLNVEFPDRIRLRVTTKVTQGTRHLIFDIVHVEQFWLDGDRTKDLLFTSRYNAQPK